MVFLAIPGTLVAIGQFFTIYKEGDITEQIINAQSILYSIFLSIWSTYFIEKWKEKLVRSKWYVVSTI